MRLDMKASKFPTGQPAASRRGVLLLVVLSVLSLFMMLGITYVIMASRARALSRGFASMTSGGLETRLPVRQLLDEAAMLVIRGKPLSLTSGTIPTRLGTSGTFQFESILADQYGNADPFSGTTLSAVQGAGPLCSATVAFTGPTPTHSLDIAGCVLTLLPKTGKASSHRILRAEPATTMAPSTPVRLVFANFNNDFERNGTTTSGTAFEFPAAGTDFKVNRRVHSGTAVTSGTVTVNEPWDGLDFPDNSFIAHVEPVASTPSAAIVIRPSMFDTSTAAALNDNNTTNDDLNLDGVDDRADNDNDGIYDGWFFDPGFPKIYSADGNEILVHMSCLVLDMDGRLNVNAHGSIADITASGTTNTSLMYPDNDPRWGVLSGSTAIPIGSGYGPAEINGSKVFSRLTGTNSMPDNPWAAILTGIRGTGGPTSLYSGKARDRITPATYPSSIGIEGRYGHEANVLPITTGTLFSAISGTASGRLPLAGFNGVDDTVGKDNEQSLIAVSGSDPVAANQWTVDLHGRMKTLVTGSSGSTATLRYVKPDATSEYRDDPYEVRLDYALRRSGLNDPKTGGVSASRMADSPFSPAEFERVLRPYDTDSRSLPGRLAALLGSQAEASRLVITADSWDTISITGSAANRVYSWFRSATNGNLFESPSGSWNPIQNGTQLPNNRLPWELAAGQRIDLTRYLESTGPGIGRRLFFKDLYMAAVALSTTSGTNPSAILAAQCAQWAANVIEYQDEDSTMEAYEYDTQPLDGWNVDGDIASNSGEITRAVVWGAERPELVIAQTIASGTNELHVVLNHPWNAVFSTGTVSTVAEPVDSALRGTAPGNVNLVRSASSSAIWQLQIGSGTYPLSSATSSINAEAGPGAWAVISPPSSALTINTSGSGTPTGRLSLPGLSRGGSSVQLLRLANPSKPFEAVGSGTAPNPYLVIDSLTVDTATVGSGTYVVNTRNGWPAIFVSSTTSGPLTTTWSGTIPWLSWPNRPLTSPAELLLVPGFNCFSTGTSGTTGLLTNYVPPSATNSGYLPNTSGTSTSDWTALDVFTVPSRFAGTRQTVDMTVASVFRDDLTQMRAGIYGNGSANHQLPSRYNQLSLGREPGRVNVNTIASDAAWDAVIAGSLPAPIATRSGSSSAALTTAPAKTVAGTLALSGTSSAIRTDTIPDASLNPYHKFYTALRLGNTATVRSHVFGIWVTVRTMETTGTGSPPPVDRETVQQHRMFLLFDRSLPVAFEPGMDLNVRDAILLQRIIQ